MRRPSTQTLIVGYPVVTIPLALFGGFFGFEVVIGNAPIWVGVITFIYCGWLHQCYETASRYRAWLREWNALDPDYQPGRPVLRTLQFIGSLVVAAALFFAWLKLGPAFADPQSPARAIAALAVVVWVLALAARLLFHRRKKRAVTKDWIVTQAVERPLPAPSADEAYASLPDYCRPLLKL